jgi:hypothetical protein
LEKGNIATSYTSPSPGEEINKCLRYYYQADSVVGLVGATGTDGFVVHFNYYLPVSMYREASTTAKLTVYGKSGMTGDTWITVNLTSTSHFMFNPFNLCVLLFGLTTDQGGLVSIMGDLEDVKIDAEIY